MRDLIYNIDYELIAFAFSILMFVEMGICYPKDAKKNQLFRLMTCMVVVTEGFDIISAVSLTYGSICPIALNIFINSGYFMSGLFLCFMLHYYIEHAIIPPEGESVLLKLNQVILIVMEISVVINAVFGYYFSFSEGGEYLHGALYLLLHLVSCWFVLCGSVAIIVNRKLLKNSQLVSSFLFIGLYFLAVIFQTFVIPDVLIIMPAASAMLIITIFTLETPDYAELQRTLAELTNTKQELEKINEKYYALAYTDLMTGLKNRTAYNIRLEQLNMVPQKESIIFCYADINHLKQLNDQLGHMIGDDAIIRAAKLLKENFSEGCQCYRIGGDEFVVIGNEVTEEEFEKNYQSFLEAIKQEEKKTDYPFSIATGYQRVGSLTLLGAQKLADDKMYHNKIEGRSGECRPRPMIDKIE